MTSSTSVQCVWHRTSSGACEAVAFIDHNYLPDWDSIHTREDRRKKKENRIQRLIWKAEQKRR